MDDRFFRIPSGCGISGIMSKDRKFFSGENIIKSIHSMIDRGNGLGSGYAGYGIYPEFKQYWCFHLMYEEPEARKMVEEYLKEKFEMIHSEPIPVKNVKTLSFIPILWRYFLDTRQTSEEYETFSEEDCIVQAVMFINTHIKKAFVFSSGKNMGIFKGVGHPDEIGEFYKIYDYKGYMWIAHNRFPTNTVGWWGGAHPFGLLDWAVVHNGEISSYGINRRYLENSGYTCTLFTDTEVIAYLFDLLGRKHHLDFETISSILSAPFWFQIEKCENQEKKKLLKILRIIYGSALINGPFGIIVAKSDCMIGLTDRIKLRPLVAGEDDDFYYIASEESAIRVVSKNIKNIFNAEAGKPVIFRTNGKS